MIRYIVPSVNSQLKLGNTLTHSLFGEIMIIYALSEGFFCVLKS